ncbi:MAG TPA: molecular chaperone [Rhodocyclaceae bacterium]|nr:molecular chaperone [Rhodocyclaceae bacterium]
MAPRKLLFGLALACLAQAAGAGSLSVSPIRVNLSEAAPTAALTVENTGNAPIVAQAQMLRWTAVGEEDRHEPSDEVVVTPPIMTIQPGRSQIVRVGLSRSADPQRELAYRLYLEEVPPPPRPGSQGLQVALRVGVPLFVAPNGAAEPKLTWRIVQSSSQAVAVEATNAGNGHLRLLNLSLGAVDSERSLARRQIPGYLLPGQSRRWIIPLKEPLSAERVRLSADSDRGAANVELDVERP